MDVTGMGGGLEVTGWAGLEVTGWAGSDTFCDPSNTKDDTTLHA